MEPEISDLQQYLAEGVETIVKDALRATLRDPKESLFMARFAAASRVASDRRKKNEAEGLHIRVGIDRLRVEHPEMVFVSFPGDEKSSGGCLAAGRGFFHINSHGGAEPCPFSPYSDINVAETSLREALNSGLFLALRNNGHLLEDHVGGCVLYEKRALVEELLRADH